MEQWDAFSALAPERFPPEVAAALRKGYVEAGPQGYWRAWVKHGKLFKDYSGPVVVARGHTQAWRVRRGVHHPRRGRRRHGARVHQVIPDPVFDPLRSDPRFDDLLRRIGVD